MICNWPTCNNSATHGDLCFQHNRVYGAKAAPKTPQSLSVPELLEKAQRAFNAWIRDRDRAFGCITCANSITEAGHYIPVGENEALRFEPNNCWGQCHDCNVFKTGNRKIYRVVLIEKVGIEEVLRLETFPRFHSFSRTEIQNIIGTYQKVKPNA